MMVKKYNIKNKIKRNSKNNIIKNSEINNNYIIMISNSMINTINIHNLIHNKYYNIIDINNVNNHIHIMNNNNRQILKYNKVSQVNCTCNLKKKMYHILIEINNNLIEIINIQMNSLVLV